MCYYLTAVLPENASDGLLLPIISSHQLAFTPLVNPNIRKQIRQNENYFKATGFTCDCDTPLGSQRANRKDPRHNIERKLKQFRNKGWSETKIKRWLEQQDETRAKNERSLQDQMALVMSDIESWIAFLRAMVTSGGTSYVGLLLHWYSAYLSVFTRSISGSSIIR